MRRHSFVWLVFLAIFIVLLTSSPILADKVESFDSAYFDGTELEPGETVVIKGDGTKYHIKVYATVSDTQLAKAYLRECNGRFGSDFLEGNYVQFDGKHYFKFTIWIEQEGVYKGHLRGRDGYDPQKEGGEYELFVRNGNADDYPPSREDRWIVKVKTVGGIIIPINELTLLTPYFGCTSIVIVATVATAIYAKRVRRRKSKQ